MNATGHKSTLDQGMAWRACHLWVILFKKMGNYTPRPTKLLGCIMVSLRPSVRLPVRLSVRQPQTEDTKKNRKLDCVATGFISDDAVNFTVDVRPSRIPCLLCSA